jgi:hypothetical protein
MSGNPYNNPYVFDDRFRTTVTAITKAATDTTTAATEVEMGTAPMVQPATTTTLTSRDTMDTATTGTGIGATRKTTLVIAVPVWERPAVPVVFCPFASGDRLNLFAVFLASII